MKFSQKKIIVILRRLFWRNLAKIFLFCFALFFVFGYTMQKIENRHLEKEVDELKSKFDNQIEKCDDYLQISEKLLNTVISEAKADKDAKREQRFDNMLKQLNEIRQNKNNEENKDGNTGRK